MGAALPVPKIAPANYSGFPPTIRSAKLGATQSLHSLRNGSMTEFAKIASAIKMWGWGRTSAVLAVFMLMRHIVHFDQALVFMLLNIVVEEFVYRRRVVRSRQRRSVGNIKQARKTKTLQPLKRRTACPQPIGPQPDRTGSRLSRRRRRLAVSPKPANHGSNSSSA